MPIYQRIKIGLYILLWFILCSITAIILNRSGLITLQSVMLGFAPYTIAGIWALYMFYPKFDPCCSVRFDSSKKLISLTFDDGPTPGFTDSVIEVLNMALVPATFFMIGEKVKANRALALKVLKNGHEIGAHTDTHKKLHFSTAREIDEQVGGTISIIKSLYKEAGREKEYRPIFRAPHGFKNIRLKLYLIRNGIALIPWTRGVWDTSAPGIECIIKRSTEHPKSNEILLLHDGKGSSSKVSDLQQNGLLQALPKVIDFYKNKGYKFIKVSDFIR